VKRAKPLRPAPGKVHLPMCDAVRTHPYHNDTSETDMRCKRRALYQLEGRNLCKTHAQKRALEILTGEK